MSEKKLQCSRYIENFNPPYLIEKVMHKIYESVADAFLDQVEYGKDYVIRTDLAKEDWADGFGTKYTYSLKFDELVRCRGCKHYIKRLRDNTTILWCRIHAMYVRPNDFCSWAEKMEQ